MRAITVVFFALALLAASASAAMQYYEAQTQADVKNLRWANCSSVVHGRLGDLHKFGNDQWHMVRQNEDFFFAYSPCLPMTFDQLTWADGEVHYGWEKVNFAEYRPEDEKATFFWVLLQKTANQIFRTVHSSNPLDHTADLDKYATFHMPSQKGEVPHFTADYAIKSQIVKKDDIQTVALESKVTVQVDCGPDDSVFMVNLTMPQEKGEPAQGSLIRLQSKEACARFPYTNEDLPPGGVAALVVIIMCFVIQFAICGWYHATHKLDINPADRGYASME